MKTALRATMFTFAVIMLSAAAYANPQPTPAASPAPAAPAPASTTATPGATTPRQGPCKTDVQNFCGSVQKGGGRVLACLKQHVGQLSPKCEAAMKRHADKDAARANQGAPITPASAPSPAAPPSAPAPAPGK